LELVEERAPDGFANLDDVVSREELEEIASTYKRTAGFDPETLNSRPSLSVRAQTDRRPHTGVALTSG
jgi:5-methylphenazine-1-carboxylate 1-monooxygenase